MIRAIVVAITCLTILASSVMDSPVSQAEGPTANTPIEHIVVLMQENHSFDNYFGTYPGANGIPPDTCMPVDPFDPNNTDCIQPFHIGEGAVDMFDPDHSQETSKIQYDDGKLDGFVSALNLRNQDGRLAMAYYNEQDLPYYWNILDQYVLFDNFFSSVQGGSFENHMYWVAATTGQKDGQTLQESLANIPTIFDRLQETGISWKFYVQNYEPKLNYRTSSLYPANRASQVTWVPLLNIDRFLDDPELFSHIVDLNDYYADLVNGTLPSVAFIVPSGPSEHPPSSVQSGQRFVKTLIQSLMQSHYWDSSVFAWAYDDWGGWYDHVVPPQVDKDGYGFRVPAILVSPYAKRGYIDHTQLDFTSFLRFIEDNWDLAPLTQRDAQANSIVGALDFTQPPRPAQFLPYERITNADKAGPDRRVIYVLYGAIVILSGALFFAATTGLARRALLPNSDRGETR
jgi:phospholipase C